MKLKLLSPPDSEPVTLTEAKAHLRVDGSDEDTLIGTLITAARQWCEDYTRRSFMDQTWQATFNTFAGIELPRGPLYELEAITYRDADSAEQTLATSVYRVLNDSDTIPAAVILDTDQEWPTTDDSEDAVKVRYRCGFQDLSGSPTLSATGVPQGIKQAILLVVGDLFEHRESRIEVQTYDNPTVRALLGPYRMPSV